MSTASQHGVFALLSPRQSRSPVSARQRRIIVRWLRRTARRVQQPHPLVAHRETLLHDRVAAVRGSLLEIAAMLERADDPDPGCISELRVLLSNGCDSPLYNPDLHISELHAMLYYVRATLRSR
jgi:hypothetical protein